MALKLFVERVGAPNARHSLIFLHGLLGNGRNVRSLARRLTDAFGCSGLLVDGRGHGKSQVHSTNNTTFDDCASDLQLTLQDEKSFTLIGHSLGGRVALHYAFLDLDPRPKRLWLLDTVPGSINPEVQQIVHNLLDFVKTADPALTHRDVTAILQERYKIDKGMAQWLGGMFRKGRFEFDLNVATDLMKDFVRQDFLGQIANVSQRTRIDMVKAGDNKLWDLVPETVHLEAMQGPNLHIHTLQNAGHWVHVDNLNGLVEIMKSNGVD